MSGRCRFPTPSLANAGEPHPRAVLIGIAAWLLVARAAEEIRRGAGLATALAAFAVAMPVFVAHVATDYLKTLDKDKPLLAASSVA
jgi:hypothetical protein